MVRRDAIGNEIKQGELVHVALSSPNVIGRIVSLSEPSSLIPGGQNLRKHELREIKTKGTLIVMCPITIEFAMEETNLSNVLKLHDPDPQNMTDQKVGGAGQSAKEDAAREKEKLANGRNHRNYMEPPHS